MPVVVLMPCVVSAAFARSEPRRGFKSAPRTASGVASLMEGSIGIVAFPRWPLVRGYACHSPEIARNLSVRVCVSDGLDLLLGGHLAERLRCAGVALLDSAGGLLEHRRGVRAVSLVDADSAISFGVADGATWRGHLRDLLEQLLGGREAREQLDFHRVEISLACDHADASGDGFSDLGECVIVGERHLE